MKLGEINLNNGDTKNAKADLYRRFIFKGISAKIITKYNKIWTVILSKR